VWQHFTRFRLVCYHTLGASLVRLSLLDHSEIVRVRMVSVVIIWPRSTIPRMSETMMTVKQVCEHLNVGRATIYRYWTAGEGPRYMTMPGGQRRVRTDWLRDWEMAREEY
jgi:excisionase family DNA binding protein